MKYDEYVRVARFLSHEENPTIDTLAISIGKKSGETIKLLEQLCSYGYPLKISQNNLIRLPYFLDLYSDNKILFGIDSNHRNNDTVLSIFVSLDSTNTYLKSLSNNDNKLLICLAEQQTQGRGRRGKSWASPFGSNIYMSIRKKIQVSPKKSGCSSLVVGLAIIKALESLEYKELQIKWPNDIYCQGKKLAGVLIEVVSVKHESIELVIGIGLNVSMPNDAAKSIDQSWMDLSMASVNKIPSRNTIVTALINRICSNLNLFESKGMKAFEEEWKRHDYLSDKAITIKHEHSIEHGKALGINEQGELLVAGDNGVSVVNAGEVSVRLLSLD